MRREIYSGVQMKCYFLTRYYGKSCREEHRGDSIKKNVVFTDIESHFQFSIISFHF